MLPWVDADALEADIRAAIDRLRPDVVITFGPDGLYWHPDHIAVHERTTAVVAAAGRRRAGALLRDHAARADARGRRTRGPGRRGACRVSTNPDAFGALAEPPTLVIEAGELCRAQAGGAQVPPQPVRRQPDCRHQPTPTPRGCSAPNTSGGPQWAEPA